MPVEAGAAAGEATGAAAWDVVEEVLVAVEWDVVEGVLVAAEWHAGPAEWDAGPRALVVAAWDAGPAESDVGPPEWDVVARASVVAAWDAGEGLDAAEGAVEVDLAEEATTTVAAVTGDGGPVRGEAVGGGIPRCTMISTGTAVGARTRDRARTSTTRVCRAARPFPSCFPTTRVPWVPRRTT